MYLIHADNVARTIQQLSKVKINEWPPDKKYIRGNPEHHIIDSIIDKGKLIERMSIGWNGRA